MRLICAAYFVAGSDIGKFTMKVADDERALNKSVHFRPACNSYNMKELASLWETKIGRTLPRVTVSEDDLLAAAAGNEKIHGRENFTVDLMITFRFFDQNDRTILNFLCSQRYSTERGCLIHARHIHKRLSEQLLDRQARWSWGEHSVPRRTIQDPGWVFWWFCRQDRKAGDGCRRDQDSECHGWAGSSHSDVFLISPTSLSEVLYLCCGHIFPLIHVWSVGTSSVHIYVLLQHKDKSLVLQRNRVVFNPMLCGSKLPLLYRGKLFMCVPSNRT